MKPHKHAEVIKAWADGAEIQYRIKNESPWKQLKDETPLWLGHLEYRVKHKHQELMDAHANGAKIQAKSLTTNKWLEVDHPNWFIEYEYRIKPELKPNIIQTMYVENSGNILFTLSSDCGKSNVKFTFDGETNKLISVEKI